MWISKENILLGEKHNTPVIFKVWEEVCEQSEWTKLGSILNLKSTWGTFVAELSAVLRVEKTIEIG